MMGQKSLMKMMTLTLLFSATLLAQGAPSWAATEQSDNGTVDYSQRMITATGIGAVPANASNAGAARANAIRAAKVDALRNLIEVVKAVRVTSESTVENNMVSSDIIRTSVEANIRGAKMVGSAKYLSDSSVEVTMTVPMSGILDAMLPKSTDAAVATAAVEPASLAIVEEAAAAAGSVSPVSAGPITGLIVDARGLGLKPSMSPRILAQDGTVLYGPGNYSREFAVNQGVVGYHKDPTAAQSDPRVAGNPATLKGVGTGGNLATDVVIALNDAQALPGMEGFDTALSNCRVMFILD